MDRCDQRGGSLPGLEEALQTQPTDASMGSRESGGPTKMVRGAQMPP